MMSLEAYEEANLQVKLGERTDQIMGNCGSHDEDKDKAQMIEEIINDEAMMSELMDLAWMYAPKKNSDDLTVRVSRGMMNIANKMALIMEELAKGIAESEAE